ncbi:hypothetical protein LTS18_011901 [Coniosporium uncinatum]|uniref:Uncharacterized protein n=1 Tax=Coniosporium uncinatum TaxID=93489 RepID=A0ACC3DD74_9PEZI|nr:hypothetical protein LTS18_011901 [Coniosporium uncinatum]
MDFSFFSQARELFQETSEEKEQRDIAGFPAIEAVMPSLPSRRNASIIDRLTSQLGQHNPFTKPVNAKEDKVWLLDNTASQPASSQPWRAEFTAAYFVRHTGKDASKFVADVCEKIGLVEGDEKEKIVAERLQPLLDYILPAHTVNVSIAGTLRTMGPSDRNGVSNNIIEIPGDYKDGQSITSHAVGIANATPVTTTFATATGWAVISDIDDTIKYTLTPSPLGILQQTFAEPFSPISGMPEAYQKIQAQLNNPPFWYLSASPYNLYPFLKEFRDRYYPPGPLFLREASWWNLAGFLGSLTKGTQAYKVSEMEKIHKNFPKRTFLCIGDSTQSDPESYGEIARKYPDWVGHIFIRKVTGVEPMDEMKKNAPERFERAFRDIDRAKWTVFEDPAELEEKIKTLGI